MATLGHAQQYDVAIHFQGGQHLYTRVEGITELSWGRKLDDYSEATVTVAKDRIGAACHGRLGEVRTWGHELTVYRDHEFVWQGPIVNKHEFRDRFVFDARDVIAWLDRRWNVKPYNWVARTDQNPDGWGLADPGGICSALLVDAFGPAPGNQFDPNLFPYLGIAAFSPPRNVGSLQALRAGEKNIGAAVRDLIEHGLDMFTVGRWLFIVPESVARANTPHRLTEHDFLGDLEVREAGLDAATRVSVIGTQPMNTDVNGGAQPTPNLPAPMSLWPATQAAGFDRFFGLIERNSSSQNAHDEASTLSIAKLAVSYGNPPPISIIVPSSTQLSPNAGIGIHELVPARRVLVSMASYATKVAQHFFINEVQASVSMNNDGMAEKVQVSLASQGSPISNTSEEAST